METQKKKLVLTKCYSKSKYKLFIPKHVEEKIRYLCGRIWNKEWSGILFYTISGSFKDNNLCINCKDIFLMDVGGVTYTEFETSPDIMAYIVDNPELMDSQTGLIHSHNTMSTFFSTTDLNTLLDEGSTRNHFVSLIVNNEGTYSAAITRKVLIDSSVINKGVYNSFDDKEEHYEDSYNESKEEIQYFDLDIFKESTSMESIDQRLSHIISFKESSRPKESFSDTKSLFEDRDSIDFKEFCKKSEKIPRMNTETGHANKTLIDSLVLQLLTGSVMMTDNSRIDLTKWVNNLKYLVERRFGKGKEGLEEYKTFIGYMVEYLLWNTEDPTLDTDYDDMSSTIANDMCACIKKLPKNVYTEICISALEYYSKNIM